MSFQKPLELVIDKIKDQRYLFLIALVLVVGGFSIFANKTALGFIVLIAGFILVGIESFFGGRGLRMVIALTFPQELDPSTVRLVKCTYSFADPRRPEDKKSGEILPYPGGGGWLCPLPSRMNPSDAVDLIFTDEDGQDWVVRRFVPELGWPTVEVQPR